MEQPFFIPNTDIHESVSGGTISDLKIVYIITHLQALEAKSLTCITSLLALHISGVRFLRFPMSGAVTSSELVSLRNRIVSLEQDDGKSLASNFHTYERA